jgi:hypothetical protein
MMSSMQMEAEVAAVRSRNLRTIGVLAALFLLPLAVSFWMYFNGWGPGARANHGELIQPPRPLPATLLPQPDGTPASVLPDGKWLLVYVGGGDCTASCRQALWVMRQSRLALGHEMTRVERAMLATAACCDREYFEREHAGLAVFDATGAEAASLVAHFPAGAREHSIYIVDPLGNLLIRFDARGNPKGFLADLKKLLKLSHIG